MDSNQNNIIQLEHGYQLDLHKAQALVKHCALILTFCETSEVQWKDGLKILTEIPYGTPHFKKIYEKNIKEISEVWETTYRKEGVHGLIKYMNGLEQSTSQLWKIKYDDISSTNDKLEETAKWVTRGLQVVSSGCNLIIAAFGSFGFGLGYGLVKDFLAQKSKAAYSIGIEQEGIDFKSIGLDSLEEFGNQGFSKWRKDSVSDLRQKRLDTKFLRQQMKKFPEDKGILANVKNRENKARIKATKKYSKNVKVGKTFIKLFKGIFLLVDIKSEYEAIVKIFQETK
jgi:hypothetical protein